MSDENVPKLRLRPKLAGGPPAPPTPPPAPPKIEEQPEDSSSEPLAVWPEAKPTALRAKLSLKSDTVAPTDEASGATKITPQNAPRSAASPAHMADPSVDSSSFAPPAPAKPLLVPRAKPTLIPTPEEAKASADPGATPPFGAPATGEKKLPAVLNAPPPPKIKVAIPTTETWPAVLDAPPQSGLSPVTPLPKEATAEPEPAEITAMRKASTFPFPSPTAKFPPLPGLGAPGGTEPAELAAPESFLKKLLLIGGAAIVLLAVGAAFVYFKFFAKPSAKPSAPPAPIATKTQPAPAQAESKAKQMIDKVQQEQLAPLNEVVTAEPPPAKPAPANVAPEPAAAQTNEPAATSPVEAVVAPPPAPVKPPPPPPPSMAFKAWVINLKIRGVRGGDAQRVFIDKISYVPGDVVNQQLGIIFAGYDENTRMLKFQDKTGATFERRD